MKISRPNNDAALRESFQNSIRHLELDAGTTTIAKGMFQGFTQLETVYISYGSGLKEIGVA